MQDYSPAPQRCTLSATQSKAPNTWAKHAAYLQREDAQVDGRNGVGWNDQPSIDIAAKVHEWAQDPDPLLYKVILSPESPGVDLHVLTRSVVQKMEKDSCKTLDWVAVDHHNTDHPHVHLLVNTNTPTGKASFATRYFGGELQAHACETITLQLGYRIAPAIEAGRQALSSTITRTTLDLELARCCVGDSPDLQRMSATARPALESRLEQLTALGLARHVPGTSKHVLHPDFRHILRTVGLAHNRAASQARGRITPSRPDLPLQLKTLEPGEVLTGVLVDAGTRKGQPWCLLESSQGSLCYISSSGLADVAAARQAKALRSGSVVVLRRRSIFDEYKENFDAPNNNPGRAAGICSLRQSSSQIFARGGAAQTLAGLRDLSSLDVVHSRRGITSVLQSDERDHVGQQGKAGAGMRWESTSGGSDAGQARGVMPCDLTVLASQRGPLAVHLAALHSAPVTGQVPPNTFAARVQQAQEHFMTSTTNIDLQSPVKLYRLLGFAENAAVATGLDGQTVMFTREKITGPALPGDVLCLQSDGTAQAYKTSVQHGLPVEALDRQIFACAQANATAAPGLAAQKVILDKKNELAAELNAALEARQLALMAGGVLKAATGQPSLSSAALTPNWASHYAKMSELGGAGVAVEPRAGANRIDGLITKIGVKNARGQRCIAIQERENGPHVLVPSTSTHLVIGEKVTAEKTLTGWAFQSHFDFGQARQPALLVPAIEKAVQEKVKEAAQHVQSEKAKQVQAEQTEKLERDKERERQERARRRERDLGR